jgi:hypothetical protein
VRRLALVGVGAVAVALVAVVVLEGRALVDRYAPREPGAAPDLASRLWTTARTVRAELVAGMTEREAELRTALIGDVDLDELRRKAPAARAAVRDAFVGRGDDDHRSARPGTDVDDGDEDLF